VEYLVYFVSGLIAFALLLAAILLLKKLVAGGLATPALPAGGTVVTYIKTNVEGVVTVVGVLLVFLLVHFIFPSITAALVLAVGWPLLVLAAIIIALGGLFLSGNKQRLVVGTLVAILLIALVKGFFFAPAPQVAAAAKSADCPGIKPTAPIQVDGNWKTLNKSCDLVIARSSGSDIELRGPTGTTPHQSGGRGRAGTNIVTDVRAKSGVAEVYYMLCPSGMGPDDGSWECKPATPAQQANPSRFVGVGIKY